MTASGENWQLGQRTRIPEEHPRLGRVPLREPVEVLLHVPLEHVTLALVELRDLDRVRDKGVVPPRVEQRERDRLRERRRLQVRYGRLFRSR